MTEALRVRSRNENETDKHSKQFTALPATQQPPWPDPLEASRILDRLSPEPLVESNAVGRLNRQLRAVQEGHALVLQIGDCVEDLRRSGIEEVARKIEFIEFARSVFEQRTDVDVLAVGRIAGQYTKPRSNDHEIVDGASLPIYRGPMVNSHERDATARIPSPDRIRACHEASTGAMAAIDRYNSGNPGREIWTSHEMLLVDYELRYLLRTPEGNHLGTTHWPWIGERTRDLGGAHVAIAETLTNPVSIKVGPQASPQDVIGLAERLNPQRVPGKLSFIARMGIHLTSRLHPLVAEVRRQGHPVNWICDPMHGNTVTTRRGIKTRRVEHIIAEVVGFNTVMSANGQVGAGLHLEATHENIYECTSGDIEPDSGPRYTTLLDPRLNGEQLEQVITSWHRDR